MNRHQLYYQISRFLDPNVDIQFAGFTAAFSFITYNCATSKDLPNFLAVSAGILAGFSGFQTVLYFKGRLGLNSRRRKAKKDSAGYPLEHTPLIRIRDEEGLKTLLERTEKEEIREWGTVFQVNSENGEAVIEEIMDSKQAEKQGYISYRRISLVGFSPKATNDIKYNGRQHYHPRLIILPSGMNYSLHPRDRFYREDGLQLLTFVHDGRAEVIGFNHLHTYIPDNEDKTVLIRANPRQIMEYLGRKMRKSA